MKDGAESAGTGAADLLLFSGTAYGRVTHPAEVIGVEVEISVVGLGSARDKSNICERIVELRDGRVKVRLVSRCWIDNVGNLKLITNLGPEVLGISNPKRKRHRPPRVDGVNLLENDISLENRFSVRKRVSNRHTTVNTVADLLSSGRAYCEVENKDGK